MDYFRPYSLSSDDGVVAAWDSVAAAAEIPSLRQLIAERGAELFPEFSKRYREIRALPRSARRTLQRKLAASRDLAIPAEWRRRLAYSVAGAALLLALSGRADAVTPGATINVGPGCTLADAIRSANTNTPVGGCTAGLATGSDIIVLPAKSTQTLTAVDNTTYGPSGLPVITSNIRIEGNGSKILRKSKAAFRLLTVTTGTLTLINSTVSGGSADKGGAIAVYGGRLYVSGCTITGNAATKYGGGVYINDGVATIDPTIISKNTAQNGGGLFNIYGSLTISNSTITGNRANNGGGIFNQVGTLVIEDNSVVSKNAAPYGGGIFNLAETPSLNLENSKVTINDSTVTGNKSLGHANAGYGGGIRSVGSKAEVDILNGSVVSKNVTGQGGGGISNVDGKVHVDASTVTGNKAGFGGGIFSINFGSYMDINGVVVDNNSTISSNVAPRNGGGINVQNSPLTLTNSTISSNKTSGYGGGIYDYSSAYNNFATDGDTFSKNVAGHGGADFYFKP